MSDLNNAIERIRILECPTGELENRIEEILKQYHIDLKDEISVERVSDHDSNGAQAYKAAFARGREIIILAESGPDDYVARVVDAKLK